MKNIRFERAYVGEWCVSVDGKLAGWMRQCQYPQSGNTGWVYYLRGAGAVNAATTFNGLRARVKRMYEEGD
jgi:hypothetical protein